MAFAATWTDLEIIIRSQVSQTVRGKPLHATSAALKRQKEKKSKINDLLLETRKHKAKSKRKVINTGGNIQF